MWLTDLLRKLTKGPNVGETFRDYIGCYLYGTEVVGSNQPEYLGAPATLEALETGMRTYLADFLSTQHDTSSPAAHTVQAVLDTLPQRLQAHISTDMSLPFLTLDGVELFIRKGVRQRRKENGKFTE
ncbi:hypothetical protein [Comamonas sp. NoAH]|uniref:hypothetical protein n=1 Tax=Comamonas halotolerans TaxID=3041496 RepID=UPI0024E0CD06|nr:hypothetical protein [Comamonas sp. NoAH]